MKMLVLICIIAEDSYKMISRIVRKYHIFL